MRALILAGVVALPFTVPADARQVTCADRAELIDWLGETFDETQRAFGLSQSGGVLELYAAENGTWTVILSMPSGKSCIITAGEAWTQLRPGPAGDPA
jgi:hypothetical protein